MKSKNIADKLKQLELYTRRIITGAAQGASRSRSKGSGLDFHQIRDYQDGDDVRVIDWKSSARMQKLLVKQFKEDKQRTVLIMLDVSGSTQFISGARSKADLMLEVAGVLSCLAAHRNDAVGAIFFSDEVKQYIPPAAGRSHLMTILEAIDHQSDVITSTNIHNALQFVARLNKKDMLICLISDFIDPVGYDAGLRLVAKKHDLIAIQAIDPRELNVPPVGCIKCKDIETGAIATLNLGYRTSSSINRELAGRVGDLEQSFKKIGVDTCTVSPDRSWIEGFAHIVKRRMIR